MLVRYKVLQVKRKTIPANHDPMLAAHIAMLTTHSQMLVRYKVVHVKNKTMPEHHYSMLVTHIPMPTSPSKVLVQYKVLQTHNSFVNHDLRLAIFTIVLARGTKLSKY